MVRQKNTGKSRNRHRRPARSRPFREPRRRLLIVCEGAVTEPGYLRGLERWLRNATLELIIPPKHGVPKTLVNHAVDLKKMAERKAKRQKDEFAAYDEVWCVFDIDAHPNVPDAKQKAAVHDVHLAISNPCFELWVLLHFRESPGAQERQALPRLVREFIPGYRKKLKFHELSPGLEDAKTRARRLDEDATKMGEPGRNPTTGVYRLVESMARKESDRDRA